MLVGFVSPHHDGVHSFECPRGEEDLSTLAADIRWHVSQDVQLAFPAVDMLNTPTFSRPLAKKTLFQSCLYPPPPIVP